MSLYLLKISGSDEVENIFEWDGSGSLTAPPGYVFELYTTESITSYSSSTELELFGGSFAGYFTGELSGSIFVNGKTFDEVINGTKYGSLVLLSYSGSNIGLVSSSNGFIVSGSNIKMSLNNLEDDKQYKYITTLSSSLSGSLKDSLLRFTNHAGSEKLEYFINSVEISSSGTSSYANLQVNELYNSIKDAYSTYSSSVDIFEDFYYSQWFVDFDLYNEPIVGQVYVNGDKLEKALNETSYGTLAFNSGPLTITDGSKTISVNPPGSTFRLSTDPANWTSTPTKITMDGFNLEWILNSIDNTTPNGIGTWSQYFFTFVDIINKGLTDSILELKHVDEPGTFKIFKIKGGTFYWRDENSLARKLDWNSNFNNNDILVSSKNKLTDSDHFDLSNYSAESIVHWPDYWHKIHESSQSGDLFEYPTFYFELDIEQIETSLQGANPETPACCNNQNNNDLFRINVTPFVPKKKRKQVYEFSTSQTPWTIPSWADKVTIYGIGAGGGGGAGAVGWGHPQTFWGKDGYKNFINKTDPWPGFEYVTGGGGGSGGNVAISEYMVNRGTISNANLGVTEIPPSSNLNIYIGSGGTGGEPLNTDDLKTILTSNDITRLKQYIYCSVEDNVQRHGMQDAIEAIDIDLKNAVTNNLKYQSVKYKSIGKNGGSTSVILANSGDKLVLATGGIGGCHGVAIQAAYPAWYRFSMGSFEDVCNSVNDNNMLNYITPGGGTSLSSTVNFSWISTYGNKEIRPGGHGGYGVAMPVAVANYFNYTVDGTGYRFIAYPMTGASYNGYRCLFKNLFKAPDIPWDSNKIDNMPALKSPYGSKIRISSQGDVTENSFLAADVVMYDKFNFSKEKPSLPAPLGGNGGIGASWQTLDVRVPSTLFGADDAAMDAIHNFFPHDPGINDPKPTSADIGNGLPNDFLQISSYRLKQEINNNSGDSYIPKIIGDNTLFSTQIENNQIYTYKFSNQGAYGGMNLFDKTDGNPLYVDGDDANIQYTLPSNGTHHGQGGGGGSAAYTTNWDDRNDLISSQAGGDGANGFVIIVVEEL